MPVLTRWFIRTSFVYLFLGFGVGILLALGQADLFSSISANLFPVYLHLLVFGWLTQLIFGVAFWMFPKYTSEKPRGSERLGWLTYFCMNLGLILRAIGEPLNSSHPSQPFISGMLVISALLQWISALAFVLNSWPRIKEK